MAERQRHRQVQRQRRSSTPRSALRLRPARRPTTTTGRTSTNWCVRLQHGRHAEERTTTRLQNGLATASATVGHRPWAGPCLAPPTHTRYVGQWAAPPPCRRPRGHGRTSRRVRTSCADRCLARQGNGLHPDRAAGRHDHHRHPRGHRHPDLDQPAGQGEGHLDEGRRLPPRQRGGDLLRRRHRHARADLHGLAGHGDDQGRRHDRQTLLLSKGTTSATATGLGLRPPGACR